MSEPIYFMVYDTSIGDITISSRGGDIIGLQFGNKEVEGGIRGESEILFEAIQQINQYCYAQRKQFELPLFVTGDDFTLKVYQHVISIPYGQTKTYEGVAMAIGEPGKGKEVEAVLLKNPIALLLPCHRVVKNMFLPGDYVGGAELKARILKMERAYANKTFVAPTDYREDDE